MSKYGFISGPCLDTFHAVFRSENLIIWVLPENLSIICVKDYFYMFSCTPIDIAQAQKKIDHWISWKLIIICLKSISEECFLFNRTVNTSLKFLWALGEHSGGSWALDYSEGTRLFGHLKLSGNRALRVIRQMSTWAFREFRHLGTQALGHLGVLGPWGTLFSRLDCKWGVHYPLNI